MAQNFRLFPNPRITKAEMKAHIRRRERRKVQKIRREYARRQVQDGLFS